MLWGSTPPMAGADGDRTEWWCWPPMCRWGGVVVASVSGQTPVHHPKMHPPPKTAEEPQKTSVHRARTAPTPWQGRPLARSSCCSTRNPWKWRLLRCPKPAAPGGLSGADGVFGFNDVQFLELPEFRVPATANWRSPHSRGHPRNLSEPRVRAVQCYDCRVVADGLILIPETAVGTATPVGIPVCDWSTRKSSELTDTLEPGLQHVHMQWPRPR